MRILFLIGLISLAGCKWFDSKPSEPECKYPNNVYTVSTPEKKASYVNDAGETKFCSVGHCKGAEYNGCSGSAELCCKK